jgi:hypothetical protein
MKGAALLPLLPEDVFALVLGAWVAGAVWAVLVGAAAATGAAATVWGMPSKGSCAGPNGIAADWICGGKGDAADGGKGAKADPGVMADEAPCCRPSFATGINKYWPGRNGVLATRPFHCAKESTGTLYVRAIEKIVSPWPT